MSWKTLSTNRQQKDTDYTQSLLLLHIAPDLVAEIEFKLRWFLKKSEIYSFDVKSKSKNRRKILLSLLLLSLIFLYDNTDNLPQSVEKKPYLNESPRKSAYLNAKMVK